MTDPAPSTTDPTTTDLALPDALTKARYASLRTFRGDGRPVDCPVWFTWSDDETTVWFRSKADTPKIRRIEVDGSVELRPCSWRGVVRPGAAVVTGTAAVVDPAAAAAATAEGRLRDRYGWQWYTTPLFRIPFTHTSKLDLPLRQKLHLIRTRQSHDGSCLVAVTVAQPRARTVDSASSTPHSSSGLR